MSDVERVDMGSQAEASSSSKRDMGSYTSTMKPSDVKALTRKYKIPRDLHPVAVSFEWTMDHLTDEYIGLYKQYFEFVRLRPIDIRGIPSGLLLSAGLAVTWEFPKFRPLFKDPEGHDPKIVATRTRKANAAAKRKAKKNKESEGAGGSKGSLKRRKPSSGPGEGAKEKPSSHIPCPTPLRTIVGVTSDVSRGDGVISPTQTQGDHLVEIPEHDSANTTTRLHEEHHDEHSGVLGNRDGNFDDDVDEEIDIEGPDRHVSDPTGRVVIETEPIPTAATYSG
ncbi:hypothetical protein Tco_0837978 [Tanacetum coccineum]